MHNRKPRIAIIVEVKKREMPFMSILREVLKHKGYDVKLIPFRSLCTWRIICFRPDIVLVNGLRHEDPYFIKQVFIPKKLFKSKIACYYSEQVGYYNESIAKGYFNPIIFDNVDYHIAWGPHFAKDLMALGVPKEKLWYVGSIQYDIDKYLKKSYDYVKRTLSQEFNVPFNKPWILYADNIIEAYQNKGLYEVRRKDTFDMVQVVAEQNPNCHIIFRHHPDAPIADIELAKRRFADISNVSVIPNGHIFDWTCAISALIIWISTSSLQAFFMGKPVFGFITSDKKNPEKYWHKDIFPTFEDSGKLATLIGQTLNGMDSNEESQYTVNQDAFVSEWYYKKDGYAFDRLCCLIDIVKDGPFYPLPRSIKYPFSKYVKILYFELQAWFGDVVKRRNSSKNIFRRDINHELEKYDVSRFCDKKFEIYETENGHYLA